MSALIENLKKQPEKEKNKTVFLLLILFAIVLFSLFGWVLKERFGDAKAINDFKKDAQPFEYLVEDLGENFNNLNTQ